MIGRARSSDGRPTIVWLTHLAAPYRVPIWRSLQRTHDVQIQTLEDERGLGRLGAENRGDDWRASRFADLDIVALRVLRLRLRGHPLWLVLPTRGARPVRRAALVVLGGGWESPAYWWLILRARLLRRPVVCFYESPAETHRFNRGVVPAARRFVFGLFDAVVVPGIAARRAAVAIGVPADRIHQGFNPVDVVDIARRAAESRAHGPDPGDGHRYVFVGQLIPRKRVMELIDAFVTAAGPGDRLTVYGVGELDDAIRARATSADVDGRVFVEGYLENDRLVERIALDHTLCLVSSEEVWGLSVNEALAAGLQVVVSANCGVAPSVDGMRGVHVVREDLADLSAALRDAAESWRGPIPAPEILAHGPEEFAEVLRGAFRSVLARRG